MKVEKIAAVRPIGVDLFSGAGGLSLGFEQAGFDIAAAVDIDPVHCAVHKFNFPQTTVLAYPIERISGKQIRKASSIGDQTVDCVFGGAPCQGFSLIGHRVLDDPRNALVREFVRIVSELKARTFVFENVKGLTVGKHKRLLDELILAFDEAGYAVRMPWQVLNAGNFDTPQSRDRLFIIGARKGECQPDYPEPTTRIAGLHKGPEGLSDSPTCSDAISDLPDADSFPELLQTDEVKIAAFGEPSPYAAELRCTKRNAWHYGYARRWDSSMLTSSTRTVHTAISRRRFTSTAPGTVEPISRFFRLSPHGVSNTLRAGTDGARGAFTSPRPIHYLHNRCITVREMARLHGFPDWFRLHATKWHGGRQVGNAVPPPLSRAIASRIIEALGVTPVFPNHILSLGDPALLKLDLTNAAAFFGVEAPLNRRDRKSGAKKRKQIEIESEHSIAGVACG